MKTGRKKEGEERKEGGGSGKERQADGIVYGTELGCKRNAAAMELVCREGHWEEKQRDEKKKLADSFPKGGGSY